MLTHALLPPLTAALLASLLVLNPAPTPHPPPPGHPPGPPPPHLVLAHLSQSGALEVDAATLGAAEQLATSRRAALTRLHEDRRATSEAYLRHLEQTGQDDPAARRAAAVAEAALRAGELELARQVHGLLTPAQREQLTALRPPPPPPPDASRLGAHARALGLDDLTADALVDVLEHHRPSLAPLHRAVRTAHDDFIALAGRPADDAQVSRQRARVVTDITRLRAAELAVLVELRSLLNADQWRALAPTLRGPPPPHHGPHHAPPPHAPPPEDHARR